MSFAFIFWGKWVFLLINSAALQPKIQALSVRKPDPQSFAQLHQEVWRESKQTWTAEPTWPLISLNRLRRLKLKARYYDEAALPVLDETLRACSLSKKINYVKSPPHTLIFLLIRAGAQGQEVLGVEAQEALDQSRRATSWEGRSEGGGGWAQSPVSPF